MTEQKIALFCASSEPIRRKGLDILLKAFIKNKFLRMNVFLVVITNNMAKKYADNIIKNENIRGIAMKSQPWEKLLMYYNAADVFIMPSKQEGIGLTYYEALLTGCPIVGYWKSIMELETYLKIDIGEKFNSNIHTENDLARKIINVLKTEYERKRLRTKAIERLSLEKQFEKFNKIYKKYINLNRFDDYR